jgi:HTH-type transcriptional regulator / antitoxin HipB
MTATSPVPDRTAALGEAVRGRRAELNLTQVEVADLAGCSQRFVHTVEQGKPTLRLDKLLDLLEVLGLGLSVGPGRGRITPAGEGARPVHTPPGHPAPRPPG